MYFIGSDKGRFVALDFETANGYRNSVCAMGLVLIVNWKIKNSFFSYINPQTNYWDSNCYRVHGIRQTDVLDSPTYEELWSSVDKIIGTSPIICHNKAFEKSCIDKCSMEFGTNCNYNYIDTLQIARNFYPNFPNHKLNTVCERLDIDLKHHHNALEDAMACAKIFLKINGKL